MSPTPSPTTSARISCGTNQYCYEIDLYPQIESESTQTVGVYSTSDDVMEDHIIAFTSNFNDCLDPKISVTFEEIDYDLPSEYFDVLGQDLNLIQRCEGGIDGNCYVWKSCMESSRLGVDRIDANETYILTIRYCTV